MQIGQDELLTECEVINQSSKRQLVIIQLNYLLIRTHMVLYIHTYIYAYISDVCIWYGSSLEAHSL